MKKSDIFVGIGVVALLGGGFVVYGAHSTAAQLQGDLKTVGYQNVQGSAFSPKATTTLHGCTIGFESQAGATRKVRDHQIHPYSVSSIGTDNAKAWTTINVGNVAPTPIEVEKYIKDHEGDFKCYSNAKDKKK